MKYIDESKKESSLTVFEDRSEYTTLSGDTVIFQQGKPSKESAARLNKIKASLEAGYLEKIISDLKNSKIEIFIDDLDEDLNKNITTLVDSVTSETGRALIGLTVMQLAIKSISPEQDIRLHKGGPSRAAFSWVEGIPMRSLDNKFVTPVLRKFNLLNLNADGFMMTRSLAENYPYTKLYKAQIKGARKEWLDIVDSIETKNINYKSALQYLISLLLNKASDFDFEAENLINSVKLYLSKNRSNDIVLEKITSHINSSKYAARLMEVAMHSLMQSISFPDCNLKPLSQMRSANKKHGNIGDIELLKNNSIIESWDAKYGKNYLSDEIDEVSEKLKLHNKAKIVGFVTFDSPVVDTIINEKINKVKITHGLNIKIMSFNDWVKLIYDRSEELDLLKKDDLSRYWLLAYAESLAQKRRDIAPIDEPCFEWVTSLRSILEK